VLCCWSGPSANRQNKPSLGESHDESGACCWWQP